MTDLFTKGKKGGLKISDIYSPLPEDESQNLADRLEKFWEEEVATAKMKNRKPRLLRTLFRMFAARYMFCGLLVCLQFTIIKYVSKNVVKLIKSRFFLAERTSRWCFRILLQRSHP